MDLNNRDDRVAAAGEYVLGTLDAADKAAFERALTGDAELRAELRFWEQRFAGLGLRLKAAAPRPMVWLDLQQRLKRSNTTSLRPAAPGRLTTAWALLATAASVVLTVGLVVQLQKPPQIITEAVPVPVAAVSYVALLEIPQTSMKWSVSVTPQRKQIVLRATGEAPVVAKDRDAELWLITDAGPVSMGLLPKSGEIRRDFPAGMQLASGKTLAVSIEPVGGSPTGSPTGPVVTTGSVLQAG